jgi:hypothetical protein
MQNFSNMQPTETLHNKIKFNMVLRSMALSSMQNEKQKMLSSTTVTWKLTFYCKVRDQKSKVKFQKVGLSQ